MKRLCILKLIWISWFLIISHFVWAQEFVKSDGIIFFNNGKYDSVISFVPSWIEEHPEEAGLALYYMAESYYNLGLSTPELGKAREYFRQAYKTFSSALKKLDLLSRYSENYYFAQYKKGWCQFRRAELEENPVVLLNLAYSDFLQLDPDAPDSLRQKATYMAGEAKIREATLRRYEMLRRGVQNAEINRILKNLAKAEKQFTKLTTAALIDPFLKLSAKIRLLDIAYEKGKLYQVMPKDAFPYVRDTNKTNDPNSTAIWYFKKADYQGLLDNLNSENTGALKDILNYLNAMRYLNIYWISASEESLTKFSTALRKLRSLEFTYEKLFRLGNQIQRSHNLKSDEFIQLSLENTSAYARAADHIEEAYYWLGFVQYIVNNEKSIYNLDKFIKIKSDKIVDVCSEALLEDARLKLYILYFEKYSQDQKRLQELETILESFNPKSKHIQSRKNLLSKLVRIVTGEDVWTVLTGEKEQRFNEAFEIIKYLLPRAASVIGVTRQRYLHQLNRIFEITREGRPNQTYFYQGIAKSLEAEIQPTYKAKERMFRQAAALLKNVTFPYKLEGNYVRARSLFFAKKYGEAKKLFKTLINQQKSLRSVYYLGEILRLANQGKAAIRCYEVVKEKTRGIVEGEFWYYNADAAINLCTPTGDLDELKDVKLEEVKFPETLLTIGNEKLSYERLADTDYLQTQTAQAGIRILKMFGLPRKTLYPSRIALTRSNFWNRGFHEFTVPINEGLRHVLATMRLLVELSANTRGQVLVLFNGEEIPPDLDGFYKKRNINLNSEVEIRVANPQCDLFTTEYCFLKPGTETLVFSLNPQLVYEPVGEVTNVPVHFQVFRPEYDRNVVLHLMGRKIRKMTCLYRDFSTKINYRDFVYSPQLDCYLVVDSENDVIWRYSSKDSLAKEGVFIKSFKDHADSLNSPEGIAIDAAGNIYIADWGNHRVVVLNPDGSFRTTLGSFGINRMPNAGYKIKFVFPTRLAIEEDVNVETRVIDGDTVRVHRPKYLFVADRFGVHKCDMQGFYIDTVVKPSAKFAEGSFYGLALKGYSKGAELYVVQHKRGDVVKFKGKAKAVAWIRKN